MSEGSFIAAFAEKLEKNKLLKFGVYGAIALLALLLFLTSGTLSSCGSKKEADADAAVQTAPVSDSAKQLEARLESILSGMAGVGKVRVMLTFDRTEEQVLAMNGKSVSGESGTSSEQRPMTVSQGGKESPVVLTEVLPRVRGVIVIAEGAGNIAVKLNISSAVSTVLGIDEKCVEVFVMEG